jgi:CDP-glycerol glycerophosphotransferase
MRFLRRIKKSSILLKGYKLLFNLTALLPADKKLIMFESYLGKQYSCNPRAIYEYIKENHPEYKLYWSIDPRFSDNFTELDLKPVNRFSIKWMFLMARAKYWVTNSRMPIWIPKPKHTIYLQTWHGTPLKKLANDIEEVHMPGTNTKQYKSNFHMESRRWDYLVSPNAYSTEIFKRAFEFNETIIESGYPRNDILYSGNKNKLSDEIKTKLNLPLNKKVILYAPTWRDNQYFEVGKYKFDLQMDLGKMKENLGEDYVIVLRMHYLVAENLDLSLFSGFAYDFSNYGDIRDLYLISDLLITDYSSVFFDYSNLRRPILFFVYDIDNYRDDIRGFYFDLSKEAPGPLITTTEELINEIKEIDKNFTISESYQRFYEKFCYLENGSSTKKVVETLLQK